MALRKRVVLITNDVFSAYQAGYRASVERAARRRDMSVMVLTGRELGHPDPVERAQNGLYQGVSPQLADGVIALSGTLANFCGTEGMEELFKRMGGVPVVSIGLAVPGYPAITLDNQAAQAAAVEHLILEHRCKRIAYVAGPSSNQEAADRLDAYRGCLARHGIHPDDALVAAGHFTVPSGRRAMQEILDRNVQFEAVVAANDAMALGALDALRAAGRRVPEDVLLVGFDDTPMARFSSRSLTTVAQPVDDVTEAAFVELMRVLASSAPSGGTTLGADLVLRESCGCGYARQRPAQASITPKASILPYLRAEKEALARAVQPAGDHSAHAGRSHWVPGLVEALIDDLDGKSGALARYIERTLEDAESQHSSLEEVGHVVARLQRRLDDAGYAGAAYFDLEQLWVKANSLVASSVSRKEVRGAFDLVQRSVELRFVTQRVATAFERRSLAAELVRSLPSVGIDTAYLGLRNKEAFRPLLVLDRGVRMDLVHDPQAAARLVPEGFGADQWSLLVEAVTFEGEFLGVLAVGGDADPLVTEAIRAQIGAALRMGELHAQVVEQTTQKERLAREQLAQEMTIARRIQSALAPKDLRAPGFDIAARMLPADVVGGDYFDVLPVQDGCWIAIGDVAGHGLMSGLIMLMIQSIVSTLVAARPSATPAELTAEVNRILFGNLRGRLQRQEHATFLLLHASEDGRVQFAGAHEDLVLWRVSNRRCEIVPTEGTWLGLVEDIREATTPGETRLWPGDLLVLLTDGVLEARNVKNEHLGLEAVCRVIEDHADAPLETIVEEIVAAANAWSPSQTDDVTCVVARFRGPRLP